MITRALLCRFAALAISLPVPFVGGCASSANEKGTQTSESIQTVASELRTTSDRIGSTLTKLNTLATTKTGDARPLFKSYSESLESLTSAAKAVQAHADKMKATGDQYFADWDKKLAEINNEDIKARSQARREEVRAQFARIRTLYGNARDQFQPFMANLRDIRSALNTDLTQTGIAALDPSIKQAGVEGAAVRSTIESLIKEFDALGVEMSSKAAPAK